MRILKMLSCFFLFVFAFFIESNGQSIQAEIADDDIFIYEYAMKKPSQAHIGFLVVDKDLIVQDFLFTVTFSNGKVKGVTRSVNAITDKRQSLKEKDGVLFLEGKPFVCCRSGEFHRRKRLNPDRFYNMISSSFLSMTNRERLILLSELSCKSI